MTNNWTFSDFCQMDIRRTDNIAEIIVEYFEGDLSKPIRLIGFATDASKTDYEIAEEGWEYWLLFLEQIEAVKNEKK